MERVYSSAGMRRIDEYTIDQGFKSARELMETAAARVFDVVWRRIESDLSWQSIEEDDMPICVGVLAGVMQAPEQLEPAAPFSDEMLVMAHFRPGMLDAFLGGFRQSRIPPVKLKAMLTETNAAWTANELHTAILAEHEQMEAMRKKK